MADGKVICKYCNLPLGYWERPKNPPKLKVCYKCAEVKQELAERYRVY